MPPGFLLPVVLLAGVVVIAALVMQVLAAKGKPASTYPYRKQTQLFSPAERSFLGVLEQAIGTEFRVMGKIRLADLIQVEPGVKGGLRQSAFNRIQSKHVDYAVCRVKDLAVEYVVELDDQSHGRAPRQARDEFVDQALQAAGLPIVHFSAKRSYAVQEVCAALPGQGRPSTPA